MEWLGFGWLADPSIWLGLITLIVLEIVLGVDNLVFIAILADKLPPHQRDRARLTGLGLALVMRLLLLSGVSWMVTLTTPLFAIGPFSFSGRALIMLAGGLFLLYKATSELHERLEGAPQADAGGAQAWASFGVVVAQIVVLDAVFSLDSVITAVGMVNQLGVMFAAVIIAMAMMIWASKPLTRFVNAHPTVVMLCLSFLLMIGLSLLAEGLGFDLPKGYLYAAIGFSVLIEALNQRASRNAARHAARTPARQRTANTILRLLGERRGALAGAPTAPNPADERLAFGAQERYMVGGVLSLAERGVRSVMTPRADVEWVDLTQDAAALRAQLLAARHGLFPVARGELDELAGVARAHELLGVLLAGEPLEHASVLRRPLVVPASVNVVRLIEQLRSSRAPMALISDEFGSILGLVTPTDLLEAIAGEFPADGETVEIQQRAPDHWVVNGLVDLHALAEATDTPTLAHGKGYSTLAGFLLARLQRLPVAGDAVEDLGLRFAVLRVAQRRIALVDVRRAVAPGDQPACETPTTSPVPVPPPAQPRHALKAPADPRQSPNG